MGVDPKLRDAWDDHWSGKREEDVEHAFNQMGKVAHGHLGAEGNIDQPPCT